MAFKEVLTQFEEFSNKISDKLLETAEREIKKAEQEVLNNLDKKLSLIVSLEGQTSEIDNLIEAIKKAKEELKKKVQYLLERASESIGYAYHNHKFHDWLYEIDRIENPPKPLTEEEEKNAKIMRDNMDKLEDSYCKQQVSSNEDYFQNNKTRERIEVFPSRQEKKEENERNRRRL